MIEPTNAVEISSMQLAAVGTAARMARLFAKATTRKWGLDTDMCDWAELVISELCGNAIKATGTIEAAVPRDENAEPIWLRFTLLAHTLVIEVEDNDPTLPVQKNGFDEAAESGRGLLLVGMTSNRWGYYPSPTGGKVVWAELALPVTASRRRPSVERISQTRSEETHGTHEPDSHRWAAAPGRPDR